MALSGELLFPTSDRDNFVSLGTWQFTNTRLESVTETELILMLPGGFRSL